MKRLLFILTFTTLVACSSSDKSTQLKSDIALENKFEELTQFSLGDTAFISFRLDTLTNFSWDSVIIFTPYSPIDKLEGELKIDLSEIKETKIASNEVSNVLAFIKGGHLINYVDLPRDKGDFSQITDTNRVFTKDNCIFELIRTHNKFISGQSIVIVKPQRTND